MLFFYGTIGLFLFGGEMNTEFMEKYEEITGDELDEDTLIFNFNDPLNAFLFFLNVTFAGYIENFNILLVVQESISDSSWKFVLVKLWLYSFYVVMEMVLLNILITFITGLMGVYEENTAGDKDEEDEIRRNQDFIDFLIDKERKDDDEKTVYFDENNNDKGKS